MKNITFRQSVLCAIKGLYFGLKTEKNYKYYLGINLAFFLLDFFYFQVDLATWYAVILSSAGVYGMECVNTAVEHLSDFTTKEQHPGSALFRHCFLPDSGDCHWKIFFGVNTIYAVDHIFIHHHVSGDSGRSFQYAISENSFFEKPLQAY